MKNDPPGSTNTLGFIAGLQRLSYFPRSFIYTTRFIYALKFAVAMTIANMGYQALCLYIDNSFAITRISPTLGRADWCLYVYCRVVIDE